MTYRHRFLLTLIAEWSMYPNIHHKWFITYLLASSNLLLNVDKDKHVLVMYQLEFNFLQSLVNKLFIIAKVI